MDTQHREIRAQLSAMAPRRAIAYIRSFDLPPDEAASLIECDVPGPKPKMSAYYCGIVKGKD